MLMRVYWSRREGLGFIGQGERVKGLLVRERGLSVYWSGRKGLGSIGQGGRGDFMAWHECVEAKKLIT
jgi:hypothetical protein